MIGGTVMMAWANERDPGDASVNQATAVIVGGLAR
jgi:hypothetical protein